MRAKQSILGLVHPGREIRRALALRSINLNQLVRIQRHHSRRYARILTRVIDLSAVADEPKVSCKEKTEQHSAAFVDPTMEPIQCSDVSLAVSWSRQSRA